MMVSHCCSPPPPSAQFDTLRRAKHSSASILHLLHNPHIPAFAHTCNGCEREIVTAVRFHCPECFDFDLCEACGKTTDHPHPLERETDAPPKCSPSSSVASMSPLSTPAPSPDASPLSKTL